MIVYEGIENAPTFKEGVVISGTPAPSTPFEFFRTLSLL